MCCVTCKRHLSWASSDRFACKLFNISYISCSEGVILIGSGPDKVTKRLAVVLSVLLIVGTLGACAISSAVSGGDSGIDSPSEPVAKAETSSELRKQRESVSEELARVQAELDSASDRYSSVLEEQKAAEEAAAKAAGEIEEAKESASEVQQKLASRVSDLYKTDQASLFLDLVVGASSFGEMLSNWNMLSAINDADASNIARSRQLRSEIAMKQMEAEEAEVLAKSKAEEAALIKDNAQAKADELQAKLDSLDSSIKSKIMEEAAIAAGRNALPDKAARAGAAAGIPTNGDVIDYAMSRLGCPYRWAASGPNAFDCSGLVMWCYAQVGKGLPHNSEAMKRAAKAVIPVSEAEPGDVLCRSGHVGLCVASGGGTYIHAPNTGDVVKVATGGRWSCALRF